MMDSKEEVISILEDIVKSLKNSNNKDVIIVNGYNDKITNINFVSKSDSDYIYIEELPQD